MELGAPFSGLVLSPNGELTVSPADRVSTGRGEGGWGRNIFHDQAGVVYSVAIDVWPICRAEGRTLGVGYTRNAF